MLDSKSPCWQFGGLEDEMRILYDHQVFSLQNLGGISSYYFELATRLSRFPGVSLDVALGANQCHYSFATDIASLRVFGWKTDIPPGFKRYALNEVLTGGWSLLQSKWDIYHSTLYRRMPTVRSRLVVATNHDCTQDRFPELFANPRRITEAKRRLYTQADAIFCVSEFSRGDLLKYYNVDPAKTHVIYPGFSRPARAPELASSFIARLRRPYLLHVGARYRYKNFNALLKAYAAGGFAKSYDLVVVGGGPFSEDEQNLMRLLELEKHVLLWPSATDAVLAEAYARATLFLSPSLCEGFGFPPLEALSLGCPVLAAASSSIPEICGDAAYYFDPAQADDLGRKIADVLNATDREQHLALGAEWIQRYSWQTSAEKTLAAYQGLLSAC